MKNEKIAIHVLGAAQTVTGSKYLIDTGERKIMVDCGLFQGLRDLRALNWEKLPVNEKEIDTVLLTHGHLDHCGYLPKLVKMGFKGSIRGTLPTLDIAKIILRDSAKIQEEDAERANKEGYTKHHPAKALYNVKDAEKTIKHFKSVEEGSWIDLYDGIRVRFQYVGHILGATFIELDVHGKRLVFSGDIGRKEDLLMRPFKKPKKADVLFIESTYGDRLHPKEDLASKLHDIILHTVEKGGTLIIPSFAVERTQTLMYALWQLKEIGAIPDIPLIMDSPMGANVLTTFETHLDWHKLSIQECIQMCNAFQIVQEYKETWEVIGSASPKIVIAGSGMVSGGRVLTYLQNYIEDSDTSILLAGFQAEGTRGRALLEGEKELKIYGKTYKVRADVFDLQVLSSHADQEELLDWMSDLESPPGKAFITHGELPAAEALRDKIENAVVPELYAIFEL